MKLPKELTTVTRVSKLIALLMLIVLPIIGFLFGMRYQAMLDSIKVQEREANVLLQESKPMPTSIRDDLESDAMQVMQDHLDLFKKSDPSTRISEYTIDEVMNAKVIDNKLVFAVTFSVKATNEKSREHWGTPNGTSGENLWVRHIYRSIVAERLNGKYHYTSEGTGPVM